MKAVDLLNGEHRLIERMLLVFEEIAGILERGGSTPPGMLAGILEFSRVYADAGHHAKEEQIFFPALAAHGVRPDTTAIGAFQAQHETGRLLIGKMAALLSLVTGGDRIACGTFAAAAREYIGLLREHIQLENQLFAEYADEHLSPEEDDALRRRMDAGTDNVTADRFARMIAEYEDTLLKCP